MNSSNVDGPPPLSCARCGRELSRGRGDWSLVEVRTVADPSPPVFTAEELEEDAALAIRELLRRIRGMSERSLREQVFARRLHVLCGPCHSAWLADPFGASGRSST